MRAMMTTWWRRTRLASLTIIATASCHDAAAPVAVRQLDMEPRPYMDLCWPLVQGQCEHRDITQNENNLIVTQAGYINWLADPFCADLYDQVFADINNHRVFIWTVGTPQYDPTNYSGDRHNGATITHLTARAFTSTEELQRTLIHETAHALGVTTDGEAVMWEETCLGITG